MFILDLIKQSVFWEIILAVLVGTYFYTKEKDRIVVLVLVLLYLTLITELYGRISIYMKVESNNNWFYNMTGILDFLIISYIYYSDEFDVINKSIIKGLVVIALTSFFIEGFFISEPPFGYYLSYSFSLMSVIVPIYCLSYLWKLLRSENLIIFSELFLFWTSIGLLFYHICTLPITVFMNKLGVIDPNGNLYTIQAISSLIFYSCLIIGFICRQKRPRI